MFDIQSQNNIVSSNASKMEILLFSLGQKEVFGINVFKIREIIKNRKITRSPNMPSGMNGVINLRGNIIPVINLSGMLTDMPAESFSTLVVVEYSKHLMGLLIDRVDGIARVEWNQVHAIDRVDFDDRSLVTASTELSDGSLVSIIDTEKVMELIFGDTIVGEIQQIQSDDSLCVFFVDDSSVARKKITEVLGRMGVRNIHSLNGCDAWERLSAMADTEKNNGKTLREKIQVILTDAEMPEMDGYALTQRIKVDKRFNGIPVVMHSSLSSSANMDMGKRVGVDYFVPKFDGVMLSSVLRPLLV